MSGAERLTASQAVLRLAAGSLTAETLVRDCLDRAEARAEVKAWVWLDPERALARARAIDRAGRHADQHRDARHGRDHGALGRRHRPVSRGDDGNPL